LSPDSAHNTQYSGPLHTLAHHTTHAHTYTRTRAATAGYKYQISNTAGLMTGD
jgi:hypothetical protein